MAGSKKADAAPAVAATPHDAVLAEAKAALAAEQADRAIALVTKAIASDPKNAALLHARGVIHAIRTTEWPSWKDEFDAIRKKSFALAAKDFDAAIALAPSYAEAYLSRGLARSYLDGDKSDFGRALELGLIPTCALQAYSARSVGSDLEIVNAMRKTRGIGHDWREPTPQLVTIRGAVPAPLAGAGAEEAPAKSDGKTPDARKAAAKKTDAKKTVGGASDAAGEAIPPPPRTKSGDVDWALLDKRAGAAHAAAVKAAARGGTTKPDDVRLDIWLSGFPEDVRAGVRVFLDPPANAGGKLWEAAVSAVGKKNELALAKAIVGRRHPPFFTCRDYLLRATKLFADDPAWLGACAHDFLFEVEMLENFRYGMENTIADLRKLVPTGALRPESVALVEKLSASKKYKPIAEPLRDWAGLTGKPSAKLKAAVAADELALHAKAVEAFELIVLEATTKDDVPRLRKLHKQLEKLDLLAAGDHPVHRQKIDAGIDRLRKRATKAPEAASRVLQNMLDAATDS